MSHKNGYEDLSRYKDILGKEQDAITMALCARILMDAGEDRAVACSVAECVVHAFEALEKRGDVEVYGTAVDFVKAIAEYPRTHNGTYVNCLDFQTVAMGSAQDFNDLVAMMGDRWLNSVQMVKNHWYGDSARWNNAWCLMEKIVWGKKTRDYKFYLTLGDFSMDGHGRYENFLVEAAKPVDDARKAHFLIPQSTGVGITAIAADNDVIPDTIATRLAELGYQFKEPLYRDERGLHLMTDKMMEDRPDILADIWVFLLNKTDPDLHAVLVEDDTPCLLTSGYKNVGYGLYKDY